MHNDALANQIALISSIVIAGFFIVLSYFQARNDRANYKYRMQLMNAVRDYLAARDDVDSRLAFSEYTAEPVDEIGMQILEYFACVFGVPCSKLRPGDSLADLFYGTIDPEWIADPSPKYAYDDTGFFDDLHDEIQMNITDFCTDETRFLINEDTAFEGLCHMTLGELWVILRHDCKKPLKRAHWRKSRWRDDEKFKVTHSGTGDKR